MWIMSAEGAALCITYASIPLLRSYVITCCLNTSHNKKTFKMVRDVNTDVFKTNSSVQNMGRIC